MTDERYTVSIEYRLPPLVHMSRNGCGKTSKYYSNWDVKHESNIPNGHCIADCQIKNFSTFLEILMFIVCGSHVASGFGTDILLRKKLNGIPWRNLRLLFWQSLLLWIKQLSLCSVIWRFLSILFQCNRADVETENNVRFIMPIANYVNFY